MILNRNEFSRNELILIDALINLFNDRLDIEMNLSKRFNAVRFESIEKKPYETFVFQMTVNEDIEFKYIDFSNIVIPSKYKRSGITTDITSILSILGRDLGYHLFITTITNAGWEQKLLKSGGKHDNEKDIVIDVDKWIDLNDLTRVEKIIKANS